MSPETGIILPVLINVSDSARNFIEGRGSRLYVWFAPVGRSGFSTQRVSFKPPATINFEGYRAGSIELFLQADFSPPEELTVRRRPWPVGPITVSGTGAGQAWGAGGDGGGANWPVHHGGGDGGGGGGGHHGG